MNEQMAVPLYKLLRPYSNSNTSTARYNKDSMDIEYDSGAPTGEVASALRKIENIERRLQAIKSFSHTRRTARKQLLMQQRKAQIRKLSQHEEEAARAHGNPKYRKDSLKGLVIQVPENKAVHEAILNPYSPRSPTYYISEVVKNYREAQSAAREHLSQSLQILKTL